MNKTNILIVEDELILAKSTAKKLNKLGYNVNKIVTTGEDAIAYLENEEIDIILMDVSIKGKIDGVETAAIIRSQADIPIIFTTAYADDLTVNRASETGCYSYLLKPFRDKELQIAIKMTLIKHQEQKVIQESLQNIINNYSSNYDDIYKNNLTNLPNRLYLRDSFDYLVSSLVTQKYNSIQNNKLAEQIAAINISIDRFKKISKLLTKEQQDFLVKKTAENINSYIKNLDFEAITIYLERDNFIILMLSDRQLTIKNCVQGLLQALNQPFTIDNQELFLSASIGIAIYPSDSLDIEELLQQSERAIEYARKQGGNRWQFFTFAYNVKSAGVPNNLNIEADLYHALERKELELYYQPKVNIKSKLIVGMEALLRWNHPVMGRISPDRFIPLAEENGLIRPIGEWVLFEACKQTKIWHDDGLNSIRVSVNLSGVQFRQSDLFYKINKILFESALDPIYLDLELTETILVENLKTNIHKLNLIKKSGVQISLDDFGTGYSSLGYLKQFPFDTLKIDSCFIRNIDRDEVNAVIVQSIIDMAHKLDLLVIAEGVETEAELNFLQQCQCDIIQGYLFSRPLNAKEFYQLAKENLAFSAL